MVIGSITRIANEELPQMAIQDRMDKNPSILLDRAQRWSLHYLLLAK